MHSRRYCQRFCTLLGVRCGDHHIGTFFQPSKATMRSIQFPEKVACAVGELKSIVVWQGAVSFHEAKQHHTWCQIFDSAHSPTAILSAVSASPAWLARTDQHLKAECSLSMTLIWIFHVGIIELSFSESLGKTSRCDSISHSSTDSQERLHSKAEHMLQERSTCC